MSAASRQFALALDLRRQMVLRLVGLYLREWAERKRKAAARHDDSDDAAFGKILGALSVAQLSGVLAPEDRERLDARLNRVMKATVTRPVKARVVAADAEQAA